MTEPINLAVARVARRQRADHGDAVPTKEDLQQVIDDNQTHLAAAIAAGERTKPIDTWEEVAAFVDEPTWQRILDDLSPATRAECERIRPPDRGLVDRQAEALSRLTRAHQTARLIPTKEQP